MSSQTKLSLTFEEVDKIPERTVATRRSPVTDLVDRLLASETQKIRISGPKEDLERIYKSVLQWRSRHEEVGLQLRKDANALYIWIGVADGRSAVQNRTPGRHGESVESARPYGSNRKSKSNARIAEEVRARQPRPLLPRTEGLNPTGNAKSIKKPKNAAQESSDKPAAGGNTRS